MTELTVEFDEARDVMYDELSEMFSEKEVDKTLEEKAIQHLTQMYDNREKLQSIEEENGNI